MRFLILLLALLALPAAPAAAQAGPQFSFSGGTVSVRDPVAKAPRALGSIVGGQWVPSLSSGDLVLDRQQPGGNGPAWYGQWQGFTPRRSDRPNIAMGWHMQNSSQAYFTEGVIGLCQAVAGAKTTGCLNINHLVDPGSDGDMVAQENDLTLNNHDYGNSDLVHVTDLDGVPMAANLALLNAGSKRATAAMYTTRLPNAAKFVRGIYFADDSVETADIMTNDGASYLWYARGAHVHGLDFTTSTFAGSAVYLGNSQTISWLDKAGTSTVGITADSRNSLTILNARGVTMAEVSAASIAPPPAGSQTLFFDAATHRLARKDASGAVVQIQ